MDSGVHAYPPARMPLGYHDAPLFPPPPFVKRLFEKVSYH